eukprot:6054353-Pleurochrysis_carterae.AAC.1
MVATARGRRRIPLLCTYRPTPCGVRARSSASLLSLSRPHLFFDLTRFHEVSTLTTSSSLNAGCDAKPCSELCTTIAPSGSSADSLAARAASAGASHAVSSAYTIAVSLGIR